jgi:hypothetical protein
MYTDVLEHYFLPPPKKNEKIPVKRSIRILKNPTRISITSSKIIITTSPKRLKMVPKILEINDQRNGKMILKINISKRRTNNIRGSIQLPIDPPFDNHAGILIIAKYPSTSAATVPKNLKNLSCIGVPRI